MEYTLADFLDIEVFFNNVELSAITDALRRLSIQFDFETSLRSNNLLNINPWRVIFPFVKFDDACL